MIFMHLFEAVKNQNCFYSFKLSIKIQVLILIFESQVQAKMAK